MLKDDQKFKYYDFRFGKIMFFFSLVRKSYLDRLDILAYVFDTIIKIRDQGITILLVEQLVQESLEIADRGYVIQTGRIVHDGPSHELLEMPEIRAAYMGM